MSKSSREEVHTTLSHLRVELRNISIFLNEERFLAEPEEIKALLTEMDSCLDVVNGVIKPAPILNG